VQKFDAITFFDLEGSYRINEYLRVAIGGRNLFDEYPDEIDRAVNGNDYCCGREFASPSVVDWQGGYYYLRVNASL
jgi:iron complex outermembrane receptor protein